MGPYLVIGLVAAVVAFVCTPVARWVSVKIGAIDHPSDRKVHSAPTPTLGGTAIFLGMAVAGVAAANMAEFRSLFSQTSEPLGIAAAAVVIFVLGFVDDLHDLPAPVKLAGQIFASGIVFLAGVKVRFILLPGQGFVSVSDDVSVLITVAWLVATINAVNLVDGLDGLAAGIVAIAASAFFVYSFDFDQRGFYAGVPTAPLVAITIVGSALGFLRHNFHPARIFMGDSGSMLLGFVLGATTVAGI